MGSQKVSTHSSPALTVQSCHPSHLNHTQVLQRSHLAAPCATPRGNHTQQYSVDGLFQLCIKQVSHAAAQRCTSSAAHLRLRLARMPCDWHTERVRLAPSIRENNIYQGQKRCMWHSLVLCNMD